MIFQKMCQSIKTCRRASRQNLEKVKTQTPVDETETATSNTSASVARDIAFIEDACCHQKKLPQQQHHQVAEEEIKGRAIKYIQVILRNIREERRACQLELNEVITELKQSKLSSTSETTSKNCLDDETLDHDVNNEQLSHLQKRMDLIQQSIVDFTELQYSVEFFKTEKQIRKMEKGFDKYWKTNNCFNDAAEADRV